MCRSSPGALWCWHEFSPDLFLAIRHLVARDRRASWFRLECRLLVGREDFEMSDFEKLLENVAQELAEPCDESRLVILKRRLLPLLEASQAMRDCNYINTTNSLRWDAALQAALGVEK